MKIFNLAIEVQRMLKKHPVLRDNDNRLIANIWLRRIPNINELDGKALLKMISQGKLPSFASIVRCRRKVQQEDKTLRGELWEKRHKTAEDIRKSIGTFKLRLEENKIPTSFNRWEDKPKYD
jgi:hypothetical protein|tara:strand:- start:295 stop:660 length:366 start_codon:yes stop_codon:yes gene_type:complete